MPRRSRRLQRERRDEPRPRARQLATSLTRHGLAELHGRVSAGRDDELQAAIAGFVSQVLDKVGIHDERRADLAVPTARVAGDDPERHSGWGVRVDPLREVLFGCIAPLSPSAA